MKTFKQYIKEYMVTDKDPVNKNLIDKTQPDPIKDKLQQVDDEDSLLGKTSRGMSGQPFTNSSEHPKNVKPAKK